MLPYILTITVSSSQHVQIPSIKGYIVYANATQVEQHIMYRLILEVPIKDKKILVPCAMPCTTRTCSEFKRDFSLNDYVEVKDIETYLKNEPVIDEITLKRSQIRKIGKRFNPKNT